MVKFAILTDVHGNFDALQTVLDDIDNREDIDQIFNLGDNIGIGHETNKVLDMISIEMIWKLLLVITMKQLCQLLMVHRIQKI